MSHIIESDFTTATTTTAADNCTIEGDFGTSDVRWEHRDKLKQINNKLRCNFDNHHLVFEPLCSDARYNFFTLDGILLNRAGPFSLSTTQRDSRTKNECLRTNNLSLFCATAFPTMIEDFRITMRTETSGVNIHNLAIVKQQPCKMENLEGLSCLIQFRFEGQPGLVSLVFELHFIVNGFAYTEKFHCRMQIAHSMSHIKKLIDKKT